jgi:choline dehydrogenase-like flavoprotein
VYDYIIVGAGSAGCVLANRLSANPQTRVLLVEAGGRDWHPFIHMPAGLAKLVQNRGLNWSYETEPEPELDNRRLYWPRGRVLGGSSSINAMCYIRGHAHDYDGWAEAGNSGWGFADVLPFFKRAQDQQRGADAWHGVGGPLAVQDLRHTNPLSDVFLRAAEAAGHRRLNDFNAGDPEGFGFYQVTQRDGRRCSAASAYLSPVRQRTNLDIWTHTLAERVEFDGDRACALHVRQGRRRSRLEASCEILLAGGAINSPQLLMLSGIGPETELRELGIRPRVLLSGVGGNLQDHLDLCLLQRSRKAITYDHNNDLLVALKYMFTRSGIGSSNIAESGGFARSARAADARPDLQFHFVPALLDDHGRNRLPGDGYTLHVCGLRPRSRGRISLRSADPTQPPRIRANYLSETEDMEVLLSGFELSREIFAQAPFADYDGGELYPGPQVRDRAGRVEYLRRKAETIYHPVGTCAMGNDENAVVDAQLRVHGTRRLRVIDASVMPTLIGGNTNAPTIMIAEKAAALICSK